MQAPKNGFFYVLDRTNGKFISADPFVYVNWASHVDSITGRPVEKDGVHYETVNTDISPSYNGGHNWHPMAFNPALGLVYIPARENVANYGHDTSWIYNKRSFGTGNGWNLAIGIDPRNPMRYDSNTRKFPRGMLIAWSPSLRKEIWRVPQLSDWNGGVLTTASGLVFQGTAQGDFIAYDGANGNIVWKINLGGGIIAPPVSYKAGNRQYISVAVGWGGGYGMKKKMAPIQTGRVFSFALNGKGSMPVFNTAVRQQIPETVFLATAAEISQGETLFWKYCGTCHVVNQGGGGLAPDLAYSLIVSDPVSMLKVVKEGAYLPLGMPNFGDRLTEKDILNIRNYVLSKSHDPVTKK